MFVILTFLYVLDHFWTWNRIGIAWTNDLFSFTTFVNSLFNQPFFSTMFLTASVVYVGIGMVCLAYETLHVSDFYSGVQHLSFLVLAHTNRGHLRASFLYDCWALFCAVDGSGSQSKRIST
jgi:hypothetical protein